MTAQPNVSGPDAHPSEKDIGATVIMCCCILQLNQPLYTHISSPYLSCPVAFKCVSFKPYPKGANLQEIPTKYLTKTHIIS
jgi:hypothetical protein